MAQKSERVGAGRRTTRLEMPASSAGALDNKPPLITVQVSRIRSRSPLTRLLPIWSEDRRHFQGYEVAR
jgi:hypothetical protein